MAAKSSAPKETIWIKASLNPALGLADSEPVWFVDTGCSNHVTGKRDFLVSYNRFQPSELQTLWLANNDLVDWKGCRDIGMQVWCGRVRWRVWGSVWAVGMEWRVSCGDPQVFCLISFYSSLYSQVFSRS